MADGEEFDVNALEFTEEPAGELADSVIPDVDGHPSTNGVVPDFVPEDKRGFYQRILNEKNNGAKTRKAPREPKKVPPKPREGALVKPLTDLYTTIGTMMMPFDQPCGTAVIANAEACAKSLENLARENPAVRRALLALVETSVWGQVLAAHSPLIIAVVMHHVPAVRKNMADVLADSIHPDNQGGLNG